MIHWAERNANNGVMFATCIGRLPTAARSLYASDQGVDTKWDVSACILIGTKLRIAPYIAQSSSLFPISLHDMLETFRICVDV